MRRFALLLLGASALVSLGACGSSTGQSSASSATPASSTPSISSPSPKAPTSSATPLVSTQTTPSATGVNFTMPNMIGKVLQDAQNALHTDGVFYSKSHDLRGTRRQVLDRDWKVCTQNVPAGQQVTGNAEGGIDFGVVKLSETCP